MTTTTATPETEIQFPIECPGLKGSIAEWAKWFRAAKPSDRTFLVAWVDCEWPTIHGHPKQRQLEILARWLDGMWALAHGYETEIEKYRRTLATAREHLTTHMGAVACMGATDENAKQPTLNAIKEALGE